jgi:hypothetical protein
LRFFDLFAHALGDSLFAADRFLALVADGTSKPLSSDIYGKNSDEQILSML